MASRVQPRLRGSSRQSYINQHLFSKLAFVMHRSSIACFGSCSNIALQFFQSGSCCSQRIMLASEDLPQTDLAVLSSCSNPMPDLHLLFALPLHPAEP